MSANETQHVTGQQVFRVGAQHQVAVGEPAVTWQGSKQQQQGVEHMRQTRGLRLEYCNVIGCCSSRLCVCVQHTIAQAQSVSGQLRA